MTYEGCACCGEPARWYLVVEIAGGVAEPPWCGSEACMEYLEDPPERLCRQCWRPVSQCEGRAQALEGGPPSRPESGGARRLRKMWPE